MSRSLRVLSVVLLLTSLIWLLGGCGGGDSASSGAAPTEALAAEAAAPGVSGADGLQPVIIGFKSKPGTAEASLVKGSAGKTKYTYKLIPAIAASLSPQAITALKRNPKVAFVEPDSIATATADAMPWGIARVNADDVWSLGNTATGVKVAIIDTGIDRTHSDLSPNYKGGYDFVNTDTDPMDDNGHGTHVSGTVAAAANGAGVVGVGPQVSLYGLKVLDSRGYGRYSDIIAALQWAVTNKMQVASRSLGGSVSSTALKNACDAAYGANVLLVAAAGNSGRSNGRGNNVQYPANYASVIAVAASGNRDRRASWSSTGPAVELTAPGVSIPSDRLGGGIISYSGTSMACPHVSGAAALVIASGVSSAADVRGRLTATARDLGVTGRDPLFGYGLVDCQKAVQAAAIASR
jgi:subtilisin family serine protease